jgi:hypothetical protein
VHLPNIKEKIPRAAPTTEVYFNQHSERKRGRELDIEIERERDRN